MAGVHLDTHLLVWLYLPRLDLLSDRAAGILGQPEVEISVSPMAILELTYLKEIGRLTVDAATIVEALTDELGLGIDGSSFHDVVTTAHRLYWTRDPFDRLIAAQALTAGATLLSADRSMLDNVDVAVW